MPTTDPAAPPAPEGFAALGLDARLVDTLTAMGYEEPTPIQRESIPPLLLGRDMIGQAATGTGKTAAFALPLLHRIAARGDDRAKPSAIVLVPTRELAMQVSEAMGKYGRSLGIQVMAVFGGAPFNEQARNLRRGADVVVATPGRALDHIRRETLDLKAIAACVLDEADEMLDMGFAEEIEALLAAMPEERQTVLFSATLPPRIAAIAKRNLSDPVKIQIGREKLAKGEIPKVRQTAYLVRRDTKAAALVRVLDMEAPTSAIVFCGTRNDVDDLTETLLSRGYRVEALHGGMTQEHRTRVIRKLKAGTADLVVATDVAARGLDVEQLSHVVNFDVPSAPEPYVHRIGRVGRAGREGVAVTLVEPRQVRLLRNFEFATKQPIAVQQVPSQADLRARRMELTRDAVRKTIEEDALDDYRAVVDGLAKEYDLAKVAAAAVKLAHRVNGMESGSDEENLPPVDMPYERQQGPGDGTRGGPRKGGAAKDYAGKDYAGKDGPANGPDAGPPGKASGKPAGKSRKRPDADAGPGRETARLFISLGRHAGVRPHDLVGAIAGEAGLDGKDVGPIQIAERFSTVDVPEAEADAVIAALSKSKIRGRKLKVRRDHHSG